MDPSQAMLSRRLARPGAKSTIALSIAKAVAMVSGYAGQIVLARLLLPAKFGQYTVVMSLLLTVELLAMEAPRAYAWALARDPGALAAVVSSIVRVLLPASVVLAVAFGAGGLAISRAMGDPGLMPLLGIAALHVPLFAVMSALRLAMVGLFRYRALVLSGSVYSLSKLACVAAFVLVHRTVGAALVANLAAALIGLAVSWWLVRPGLRPSGGGEPLAWSVLTLGLWLAAARALAVVLCSADVWLLKGLGAAATLVGLYGASYALSRGIVQLSAGLSTGIFPVVSHCAQEGQSDRRRRVVAEAIRLLLVVFLPAVTVLSVCSRPLLSLCFSARYQEAGPVLRILAFSGWGIAAATTLQSAISAVGRARACALVNAALVPFAIAAALLLIPRWGALGAATGSLATALALCVCSAAIAGRVLGNVVPRGAVARGVVAAAAAGAVCGLCPGEGWAVLPRMALGMAAAVLALWAAGGIRRDDVRTVAALLRWAQPRRASAE